MHILLQGRIAVDHLSLLQEYADPSWQISTWDPELDEISVFNTLAATADVIIGGNIPTQQWPAVPHLKLIQIPWAGYNFTSPEMMAADVPVANCYEHETAIAEYVMLAILEWQIRLSDMDKQFRSSGWSGRLPASGPFHREVRDHTVGIVGYGHIGEALAKRAAAFDMNVIATRRKPQPAPEPLSWLGTQDQLPTLLSKSDFVVLCCDLNADTENLINEQSLTLMKSDAVLINIARGEIIHEQDLYNALQSGQIGGAVLDVWYNYNQAGQTEVWPSNLPFQELDNVILSPHQSAWTEAQDRRRWQYVADNIRRIDNGEAPTNIVFTGTATTEEAL